MWGISKARLECLRSQYAPGTRVELVEMNDRQAPPPGTKGTVLRVDDIGTIHVHWDNGNESLSHKLNNKPLARRSRFPWIGYRLPCYFNLFILMFNLVIWRRND